MILSGKNGSYEMSILTLYHNKICNANKNLRQLTDIKIYFCKNWNWQILILLLYLISRTYWYTWLKKYMYRGTLEPKNKMSDCVGLQILNVKAIKTQILKYMLKVHFKY